MPRPDSDLRGFDLRMQTESYRYRTPMKFGGRVVEDVTVLSIDCDATTASGQQAIGHGSMTMGVAWAWPDTSVTDETKLSVVLDLARELNQAALAMDQTGHPMHVCLRLSGHREEIAKKVATKHSLAAPIPELAILLAGSALEASLFDAQGKALQQSSYSLLGTDHLPESLGDLLGDARYAGRHLNEFVLDSPRSDLPLYHLVGALDPLTPGDLLVDGIDRSVRDGLPETLEEWIQRNELTHLKIKLNGDDAKWDRERIIAIDRAAVANETRGTSTGQPFLYSLDFNERCENEDYVLELLESLRSDHPTAFEKIQYVEQPTNRDLKRPDAVTMHRASRIRPVVIDESLTDLESLDLAIAQGYSGIALKACKGHAEALLLGAVAQFDKRFLCVQDLTCVGASLLHSASLSAHFASVAAVESNGRQYCPAGNQEWMSDYEPMFEIRGGRIPTQVLSKPGLGYAKL